MSIAIAQILSTRKLMYVVAHEYQLILPTVTEHCPPALSSIAVLSTPSTDPRREDAFCGLFDCSEGVCVFVCDEYEDSYACM